MALKAVLFDLDNTLVDYMGFKVASAAAAAEELVRRKFPDTFENLFRKIFEIYERYGIEYQKTFYQLIAPYGIKDVVAAELFQQAAIRAYVQKKVEVLRPYKGAPEALEALRGMGLKLGIVTDAPRNKACQRLVMAGLDAHFDVIVARDDAGEEKPHRAPFELALAKLGVKPGEAMMVGDHLDKDMAGAKRMGIQACHALYGARDREKGAGMAGMRVARKRAVATPDFTISRIRDLPPLAARLMK
jgi:putative hydrolase of the HAD superfamily